MRRLNLAVYTAHLGYLQTPAGNPWGEMQVACTNVLARSIAKSLSFSTLAKVAVYSHSAIIRLFDSELAKFVVFTNDLVISLSFTKQQSLVFYYPLVNFVSHETLTYYTLVNYEKNQKSAESVRDSSISQSRRY